MRLFVTALLSLMCAAVTTAQDPPKIAPCPDFTGTFQHPGPNAENCRHTSRFGFGAFVLPSIDKKAGGYQSMYRPGILEIQQSGCAALTIAAAVSWRSPDTLGQGAGKPENYIDVPWSRTFHLLPPEKGEDRFPPTVEWTENSLSFRSRFIAAGFGAGWGHNAMVFTLEWKDAETLLYSFRHEKGRRGKKYMDIQCELKRVDGDGDAG